MSNESLVNKLRNLAPVCRGQAEIHIEKAADEIERLLAENAELRSALEKYAPDILDEIDEARSANVHK